MEPETHETRDAKIRERKRLTFGERYLDANLAKLIIPIESQAHAVRFLENPKNFLVFCGNPGIGKTFFCAALFEWALTKFDTVRYHNEAGLLQRLRDCIAEDRGDYLKALELLIDDNFVILDDIGSQGINEWRSEIIFDAIDYRYNSMKPTVITSNFSKQDFKTKYHPRLSSRLFAQENTIIEMNDVPDLRAVGK